MKNQLHNTSRSRLAPDSAAQTTGVIPRGTETILLVEDDSLIRGLTLQILERSGYRVFEAEDELAALDIWDQHASEIQVLLTDMNLCSPQSGCALARTLRAINPELKIIVTSGMHLTSIEQLTLGFRFLPKPLDPLTLLQAMRDELDGTETEEQFLSDCIRGY